MTPPVTSSLNGGVSLFELSPERYFLPRSSLFPTVQTLVLPAAFRRVKHIIFFYLGGVGDGRRSEDILHRDAALFSSLASRRSFLRQTARTSPQRVTTFNLARLYKHVLNIVAFILGFIYSTDANCPIL